MIDSSATSNFITKAFVKREKYLIRKKFNAYNLVIVDENTLLNKNERIDKETKSLLIAI
jgi:hypothetical protein